MLFTRISLAILVTWTLAACSRMAATSVTTSQNSPQGAASVGGLTPLDPGSTKFDDGATSVNMGQWAGLSICSELDFKGLTWSTNVPIDVRDPFALALNISGSFEGSAGWANLTNNFDGQGLSMGLLNQNLGQGSLQPMWVEMRNSSRNELATYFTTTNLTSMLNMLKTWESSVSSSSAIELSDYGYNGLDDPDMVASELGMDPLDLIATHSALLARNQTSVTWATKTVYSGSSFKSDWRKSLLAMANSATYRSIQVRKAEKLHNGAEELMNSLKFTEWRSYLFFFDIMVQNGGISTAARTEYKAWAAKNLKATEETRLKQLLTIRLKTVISTYVADVRARKMSLILGTGTVHGEKRTYEKEFCTDINALY